MDRRKFIAGTGLIAASSAVSLPLSAAVAQKTLPVIKPQALKKGDLIGLVTPASAAKRDAFESAVSNLESLGFEVKYSENMNVRKGFLGGTDGQRADDLHKMFEDPDIKGIVCVRGGYGSGRLLSLLDYELIKSNPKVLVGYSDITALLYGIHSKTGLVCFHGPVGASDYSDFTSKGFVNTLIKGKNSIVYERPKYWDQQKLYYSYMINSGSAEGTLVGGNLSLMCSLMGTPYDIDFEGKIVFIEEVGESPYRVDRMLTQLLNSGKLDNCSGIALGVFNNCETKPEDPDFAYSTSLKDVIVDRLQQVGRPCIYGLPIGHIADNATLPFGINASLDADNGQLKVLESAVS